MLSNRGRGYRAWPSHGGRRLDRACLRAASAVCCVLLLSITIPALGRDLPPSVPPPKPVELPAPALETLPNGLQVVVFERHALPLVTLRLVVKSGAESDAPGLPGEAQFVASLLNEGTASRGSQQIAAAIDDVGGLMDTGADWDQSYGTVTVLADHVNLAFDLLSDIIIHPAFRPDDVERIRKQTISALKVLKSDPSYLADTVFNELVLAGTPYSHPENGGIQSITKITVSDLQQFHERYYQPSNSVLAAVGDISARRALRLAKKYFGSWQGSGVRAPSRMPQPQPLGRRQIVVIDKPDAVQTEIRVGSAAIPRGSPNYLALNVANQILGGPANNRLFEALRTRHGLAYGASSDLNCYLAAGDWVAKTSTRTPETVRSIDLILEQMKRLRKHGINGFELSNAQSYLVGHMALQFETSDDIASHFLTLLIEHLPLDYWNQFPNQLHVLTPREIAEATRRYLNPNDVAIVLVGKAEAFKQSLQKLGDVHVIPIDHFSLASIDLETPGGQPGGT
jgi:zinc protease